MSDQARSRVIESWTVPVERGHIRLDAFARACLPHLARREVDRAISEGLFLLNGRASQKGERLNVGDTLAFTGSEIWMALSPPPNPRLRVPVVYEDQSILVVDKPAGMPTHGFSARDTDTLANYIASKHAEILAVGKNRWEPGIVHRLDIETSGLVLVAKTPAAFADLRQQFRRRQVTKMYWALVWGLTDAEGVIESPLAHERTDRRRMRAVREAEKSKNQRIWPAATEYRRIGQARGLSLLEVRMKTGVTHQIRVHLAAIGHPIVADALYGTGHSNTFGLQRHFLHARGLAFRRPDDGRLVTVDAKLPEELQDVLRRVGMRL